MKTSTAVRIFSGIMAMFICLFLLGGCNTTANDPNSFTFDKDTSYAFGMYIASQFMIPDTHYDYQSFMEGFRAYNEMLESKFSMDEAIMKIQTAFDDYNNWYMSMLYGDSWSGGQDDVDLEKNREDGIAFLADNARRPGVRTLASGLQYEVLREGSGGKPSIADVVEVHYEGTLIDGTVFDSSYQRGTPVEFPLAGVIQGWTEGLQLMDIGSMYMLYIPYDLGYGTMTNPPIPGYSTLIFRVELLSITKDGGLEYLQYLQ